jgi:hypothetical protein
MGLFGPKAKITIANPATVDQNILANFRRRTDPLLSETISLTRAEMDMVNKAENAVRNKLKGETQLINRERDLLGQIRRAEDLLKSLEYYEGLIARINEGNGLTHLGFLNFGRRWELQVATNAKKMQDLFKEVAIILSYVDEALKEIKRTDVLEQQTSYTISNWVAGSTQRLQRIAETTKKYYTTAATEIDKAIKVN